MKIMFVCLSLHGGGTERVVTNLANYFSKSNSVKIITIIKSQKDYPLDDDIDVIEVDNHNFNEISAFKKKLNKISFKRILKLKKQILKYSPDIIISFLPLPSLYIMLLKKINSSVKKIPVILSERGDPNVTFKNKVICNLMKKLYKNVDGFVFQTKDAKKYYDNIINCESKIIGNPLNVNFIQSDYSHNREKTVVTVGRLEKQKNHKLLIDAFEEFIKKHLDYKLLIYGDGSLKNELQQYIQNKHLEKSVLLKGKSSQIYNEIYNTSIFALTSNFEGMPNALMEAMALGIPCISTDCPVGGPKTLIEDNYNGLLIQMNDKKQLCDAMDRIVNDKELSNTLSKNAIKSSEKYHPNKINKEWQNFINQIYKKKNKYNGGD